MAISFLFPLSSLLSRYTIIATLYTTHATSHAISVLYTTEKAAQRQPPASWAMAAMVATQGKYNITNIIIAEIMFNFSYFSAFFATWVAYIGVFMPIFSFIITFVTNRVAIIVKGVVAYIAAAVIIPEEPNYIEQGE